MFVNSLLAVGLLVYSAATQCQLPSTSNIICIFKEPNKMHIYKQQDDKMQFRKHNPKKDQSSIMLARMHGSQVIDYPINVIFYSDVLVNMHMC